MDFAYSFVLVRFPGAVSIIETDCEVDFDEPLGFKGSKYDYSAAKAIASTSSLTESAGTTSGGVVRELQKAKREDTEKSESVFKPFEGPGQRIDGKGSESMAFGGSPPNVDIRAKRLAAVGGGGGSASSSSSSIAAPAAAVEQFQSKIGDKFSKKKVGVSAFTGPAHKLT